MRAPKHLGARNLAVALSAAGLVVAMMGCGSDDDQPAASGGSGGSGGGAGAGGSVGGAGGQVADTTAPTLRDLRVEVSGVSAPFDLNNLDKTHVLPGDSSAEFTVLARDDTTATENLTVEVLEDGTPLTPTDSSFASNLWRVTVQIQPGTALTARVTDEAGNATLGEHQLVLPSHEQAVVADWENRFFDTSQGIVDRWLSTWDDTGAWSGTHESSGFQHAGSYAFVDGLLEVSETTSSGGTADDADPTTVESKRVAAYYIDGTYFSEDAYVRTAGASGTSVEGTWERSYELYEPGTGSTLELTEQVTETLVFGSDGSFSESRTGTISGSALDETRSGTFSIELNDNYAESFGDFLSRIVTHENGVALGASVQLYELQVVRHDQLLITPKLRMQ